MLGIVAVGVVRDSRIFRAPMYRAHRAVIFAIAQLSCCLILVLSQLCQETSKSVAASVRRLPVPRQISKFRARSFVAYIGNRGQTDSKNMTTDFALEVAQNFVSRKVRAASLLSRSFKRRSLLLSLSVWLTVIVVAYCTISTVFGCIPINILSYLTQMLPYSRVYALQMTLFSTSQARVCWLACTAANRECMGKASSVYLCSVCSPISHCSSAVICTNPVIGESSSSRVNLPRWYTSRIHSNVPACSACNASVYATPCNQLAAILA